MGKREAAYNAAFLNLNSEGGERLKRMFVILLLMAAALIVCTASSAELLSDVELAKVYAGEVDSEASDVITVEASSLSNQKNIAGVSSLDSGVRTTRIRNTNRAEVENIGDSAVALQANLAAIASLGAEDALGNVMINRNNARVDNLASAEGFGEGLSGGSLTTGASSEMLLGSILALQSAVVGQSNIAALAALGNIRLTFIDNDNRADVDNIGDSALALQSNIAGIAGLGAGEVRGDVILNSNRARVDNLAVSEGLVEADLEHLALNGDDLISGTSSLSASQSAVASQFNIGAISGGADIRNTRIRNDNRADAANIGDSAVAMQTNIAAIAGLGAGELRGNDIHNRNDADVENVVLDAPGFVDGLSEGLSANDAGIQSALSALSVTRSAVASQANIAAVMNGGGILNTGISNRNNASVNNNL